MCPRPEDGCWGCPNKSKYKCPKCEVRSCSLACVKRHKLEADCDGLRDKTKYLPLQKFTDMDVVNDFRLLEEVTSTVDKCKRDKIKRSTRQGTDVMIAPRLNKQLQRLQSQAKNRNCTLKILPPHFSRRKENTSTFDFKQRAIKWHVLLKFINIDKKVSIPAIDENTKLWEILRDFVEFQSQDDPSDPFQMYRSLSYGGLSLYLKAEAISKSGEQRQFWPLDMRRSLKTNLKEKIIVEHPVIHIVYKRDDHLFRDEADDFVIEEENPEPPTQDIPGNPNLGDIMGETDAMAADPEAYKQYFDFYLKYYTQKFAQQGVEPALVSGAPPVGPLPNYSVPPPSLTPSPHTANQNTFPARTGPTPANILKANNSPQFSSQGRVTKTDPIKKQTNYLFSELEPEDLNQRNHEEAKSMKSVLRNKVGPLSSLVQYDMSDSDCEN